MLSLEFDTNCGPFNSEACPRIPATPGGLSMLLTNSYLRGNSLTVLWGVNEAYEKSLQKSHLFKNKPVEQDDYNFASNYDVYWPLPQIVPKRCFRFAI